jgi:hypothetical protein
MLLLGDQIFPKLSTPHKRLRRSGLATDWRVIVQYLLKNMVRRNQPLTFTSDNRVAGSYKHTAEHYWYVCLLG